MIASKDRCGYFGASDTQFIIGNWKTKTFEKWWLEKLGFDRPKFENRYTLAGTHYEHAILDSLGLPMYHDRQIIIEPLRLRINLDGDCFNTIYECKTHKGDYRLPRDHYNQVQVQMYGTGWHTAVLVSYQLLEGDYKNFFNPIDPQRRNETPIAYDEKFINVVYLPRLYILRDALMRGVFPSESQN